jgi:hypothetical protein
MSTDTALRAEVSSGLVFQLESLGLWEWAVYVTLQLPKEQVAPPLKERLAKELVLRHGGQGQGSALLQELRVPQEWLEQARALRLRYEGRLLSYEAGAPGAGAGAGEAWVHALRAKEAELAHEVVANVAAPTLIVQQDLPRLGEALQALLPVRRDVRLWSRQGGLFQQYWEMKRRVEELGQQGVEAGRGLGEALGILKALGQAMGLEGGSMVWEGDTLGSEEAALYPTTTATAEATSRAPVITQAARCVILSELASIAPKLQRLRGRGSRVGGEEGLDDKSGSACLLDQRCHMLGHGVSAHVEML